MDITAERLLDAMWKGVYARRDLLSAVLPRVSPEYVVVASALHGVLVEHGAACDVRVEQPIPSLPRAKCDVVVRPREAAEAIYFEFKPLWPRGAGENATGIKADLAKLAGLPNAFAVAFAFSITEVPLGCEGFLCDASKGLDWAIGRACARLEREPVWATDAVELRGNGVRGEARLLAWKA